MKRDTLLEKLELPINQPTKDLITASTKYGITTGAHLHFAVLKDGVPIDPLSLLSAR